MSIKTLHITNAWHATSGGIGTFYRALFRAANELGREMRLVVPGESDGVEQVGPYGRIYYVKSPEAPLSPAYRIMYPTRFLLPGSPVQRILRDEQPDLVEVCDKYTLLYLGGMLRVGLTGTGRKPVVIGLSCERMDDNVAAYKNWGAAGRLFCRLYMKCIYFPHADHHIAVSHYTAGELEPAARGHKVKRGVWVYPMGVDLERFSSGKRNADKRSELLSLAGGGHRTVLLLYAGRIAPEKNIPLLVDTMTHLARRDELDCRLLIAGEGTSLDWLRSESERLVPGRVCFLGHVRDRDALAGLYANADIFVHPNPREPFGIAPLEAMASGLALVAPNSGGVTTYANEGNAWLGEPAGPEFAAAILRAATDPELEEKLTAARATAETYAWPKVCERFFRLYDELHARVLGYPLENPVAPAFYSTPGNWLGMEVGRKPPEEPGEAPL